MEYKRTVIAGNVGFSTVIDEKFKTGSLVIRFMVPLDSKTAAANAMGMSVLTCSNSKLATLAKLNEKLSALYGAGLSSFARKRGDVQILGVAASWINDRYAFDGENISGEMTELVRDCLFAPNASDGEFDADSFRITKKEMLDRIDAELNNKRGYAISRAAEIAFRGEPAENSCYGTRESAEGVSSKEAYSAYRKLLETAQVEIFYVAAAADPALEKAMSESFGAISRQAEPVVFRAKSPLRSEVVTESDEFDVRQCKMVLTFKSDSDDMFAMKLLSTIYGETPVSKLFMNVREKMSLCYYCACRTVASKGALTVDSGVERENIEKAKTEIIRQLDEIRQGNITDEELESALLSLDNALTQVGDTPNSYSSWYFERFCDGNIVTPEQQFTEYKNVTKARIVQAANSLSLDSVYLMLDKEAAE